MWSQRPLCRVHTCHYVDHLCNVVLEEKQIQENLYSVQLLTTSITIEATESPCLSVDVCTVGKKENEPKCSPGVLLHTFDINVSLVLLWSGVVKSSLLYLWKLLEQKVLNVLFRSVFSVCIFVIHTSHTKQTPSSFVKLFVWTRKLFFCCSICIEILNSWSMDRDSVIAIAGVGIGVAALVALGFYAKSFFDQSEAAVCLVTLIPHIFFTLTLTWLSR